MEGPSSSGSTLYYAALFSLGASVLVCISSWVVAGLKAGAFWPFSHDSTWVPWVFAGSGLVCASMLVVCFVSDEKSAVQGIGALVGSFGVILFVYFCWRFWKYQSLSNKWNSKPELYAIVTKKDNKYELLEPSEANLKKFNEEVVEKSKGPRVVFLLVPSDQKVATTKFNGTLDEKQKEQIKEAFKKAGVDESAYKFDAKNSTITLIPKKGTGDKKEGEVTIEKLIKTLSSVSIPEPKSADSKSDETKKDDDKKKEEEKKKDETKKDDDKNKEEKKKDEKKKEEEKKVHKSILITVTCSDTPATELSKLVGKDGSKAFSPAESEKKSTESAEGPKK